MSIFTEYAILISLWILDCFCFWLIGLQSQWAHLIVNEKLWTHFRWSKWGQHITDLLNTITLTPIPLSISKSTFPCVTFNGNVQKTLRFVYVHDLPMSHGPMVLLNSWSLLRHSIFMMHKDRHIILGISLCKSLHSVLVLLIIHTHL